MLSRSFSSHLALCRYVSLFLCFVCVFLRFVSFCPALSCFILFWSFLPCSLFLCCSLSLSLSHVILCYLDLSRSCWFCVVLSRPFSFRPVLRHSVSFLSCHVLSLVIGVLSDLLLCFLGVVPPPWVPWGIPGNFASSPLKAALPQTKRPRASSS